VTLASLDPGEALARILRLSAWIVKHFCHRKEFRRKARPNLVQGEGGFCFGFIVLPRCTDTLSENLIILYLGTMKAENETTFG
jgi:hypothetical protein